MRGSTCGRILTWPVYRHLPFDRRTSTTKTTWAVVKRSGPGGETGWNRGSGNRALGAHRTIAPVERRPDAWHGKPGSRCARRRGDTRKGARNQASMRAGMIRTRCVGAPDRGVQRTGWSNGVRTSRRCSIGTQSLNRAPGWHCGRYAERRCLLVSGTVSHDGVRHSSRAYARVRRGAASRLSPPRMGPARLMLLGGREHRTEVHGWKWCPRDRNGSSRQ